MHQSITVALALLTLAHGVVRGEITSWETTPKIFVSVTEPFPGPEIVESINLPVVDTRFSGPTDHIDARDIKSVDGINAFSEASFGFSDQGFSIPVIPSAASVTSARSTRGVTSRIGGKGEEIAGAMAIAELDTNITLDADHPFRVTGALLTVHHMRNFENIPVDLFSEFDDELKVVIDAASSQGPLLPRIDELETPEIPIGTTTDQSLIRKLRIDQNLSHAITGQIEVTLDHQVDLGSDGWQRNFDVDDGEEPFIAIEAFAQVNVLEANIGATPQNAIPSWTSTIPEILRLESGLLDELLGQVDTTPSDTVPSQSVAQYPYLPSSSWFKLPTSFVLSGNFVMLEDDRFNRISGADGLSQAYRVIVEGQEIATLQNGEIVDFIDLLGEGVEAFSLAASHTTDSNESENESLADAALMLEFDHDLAYFYVLVPEPTAVQPWLLAVIGFVTIFWRQRYRTKSNVTKPLFQLGCCIACLMTLLAPNSMLRAATIVSPTQVLGTDLGTFSTDTGLENMINHSGLDKPFTSGVTNFDDYFDGGDSAFGQGSFENNWQSDFSFDLPLMGYLEFDLGAIYTIDRLAIWNRSLQNIQVLLSQTPGGAMDDAGSFTLDSRLSFPFSYLPQILELDSSHDARYVRIEVNSAHKSSPSDTFAYAIVGEVAARVVAVPEPSSLVLLVTSLAFLVRCRGPVTKKTRRIIPHITLALVVSVTLLAAGDRATATTIVGALFESTVTDFDGNVLGRYSDSETTFTESHVFFQTSNYSNANIPSEQSETIFGSFEIDYVVFGKNSGRSIDFRTQLNAFKIEIDSFQQQAMPYVWEQIDVNAVATAAVSDEIVFSAPGKSGPGSMLMFWEIEGGHAVDAHPGFGLDTSGGVAFTVHSQALLSIDDPLDTENVFDESLIIIHESENNAEDFANAIFSPEVYVGSVAFQWDQPTEYTVGFQTFADFNISTPDQLENFIAEVIHDFDGTARLVGIMLVDEAGEPVTKFTAVSTANIDYNFLSVPEPSSGILLVGLILSSAIASRVIAQSQISRPKMETSSFGPFFSHQRSTAFSMAPTLSSRD